MIPAVTIIFNILQWMLWVAAVNLLLPRRFSLGVTLAVELSAFVAYYWLTLLLLNTSPAFRFLFGTPLVIAFFTFMHQGRWYVRVGVGVSLFLIAMIADIATYYATMRTVVPDEMAIAYDFEVSQFAFCLMVNIALLSLLILAGWALRRDFSWELSTPQMILFTLFPASQLALLLRWTVTFWYGHDRVTTPRILLILFLTLAADAALFRLIRSVAEHAALEAEIRCREEERGRLQKNAEQLRAEQERAEQLEREVNAVWEEMRQMVTRGDTGELIRRADEIGRVYTPGSVLPECADRALSGFLAKRRETLESSGITTEFSVSLPARPGIPDPDLICLFGNLLDNAAEACEGMPEAIVRLTADVREPYLRVRIDNSYLTPAEKKRSRIPGLERGLGFTILQRLAEKYDGEFRCTAGDPWYSVSVTLKGEPR